MSLVTTFSCDSNDKKQGFIEQSNNNVISSSNSYIQNNNRQTECTSRCIFYKDALLEDSKNNSTRTYFINAPRSNYSEAPFLQMSIFDQLYGFKLIMIMPNGAIGNTESKFTFDELHKMCEYQLAQNATEPVNNLMKFINNGVNRFTAAQLAQFVLNFNPSEPTAKRILKEGSKNYKPDIVKVWNQIWNGYKSDPNGFIVKTVNSGQIYNVNELMRNWTATHSGSSLAQEYFKDPSMIKLDQLSRTNDALNVVRNNNYDKIRSKFTQDLNYIVDKVKSKDPQAYKNLNDTKIQQAIDLMMNRYTLDAHGNMDEFKEMAPEVDKQIASILGFSIGKTTNQKAEAKWYNYLVPLTNIPRWLGDGRENVKDKASWVADVFDMSFEDLSCSINKYSKMAW